MSVRDPANDVVPVAGVDFPFPLHLVPRISSPLSSLCSWFSVCSKHHPLLQDCPSRRTGNSSACHLAPRSFPRAFLRRFPNPGRPISKRAPVLSAGAQAFPSFFQFVANLRRRSVDFARATTKPSTASFLRERLFQGLQGPSSVDPVRFRCVCAPTKPALFVYSAPLWRLRRGNHTSVTTRSSPSSCRTSSLD